jgi:bifunctional UDP-N-acetylglucosamine pyrophosphorylase/glucosamine-1-phosphate N-acetyltransferase
VLVAEVDDPTGYGRVLRDAEGKVGAIVEQKDATDDQLRVRTINTGIIAAESTALRRWLSQLSNSNAQGEYYLTDVFAFAAHEYTRPKWRWWPTRRKPKGQTIPGSCRSWSVPGSAARCVRCARTGRACATRHDSTSVAPSPWAVTC